VKTAIMQPYFLPYIGYWQLINAVDQFVIYDNIEYTKKGWFNRNRILENDHDRLFTIPIKKDSDFLTVDKRFLSDEADKEVARTLRIIETNYRKAPQFEKVYPVIRGCFLIVEKNLFAYIYNSIQVISKFLGIKTTLVVSSTIPLDHSLKSEDKVLAICKALGTKTYINAIGGEELYSKETFNSNGIELQFIKSNPIEYQQFDNKFVPWLSIIDIMMFNEPDKIKQILGEYKLI
jgi:hypothetical protein